MQGNISNQMNMNNPLENLLNLLNTNILILDYIRESRNILENNMFLIWDLIDNLSDNNVNNNQNKYFIRICFNKKLEKYLLDNSKSNNNYNLISQCFNQFLEHKNRYENFVSSLINTNIFMNNDGDIYNAIFEEKWRKINIIL